MIVEFMSVDEMVARWFPRKSEWVYCPTHGVAPFCSDVENGNCAECSREFHEELVEKPIRYVPEAECKICAVRPLAGPCNDHPWNF